MLEEWSSVLIWSIAGAFGVGTLVAWFAPEKWFPSKKEPTPLPEPVAEFISREEAGALVREARGFRSRLGLRPGSKKIGRTLAAFEEDCPAEVTGEGYDQMTFQIWLKLEAADRKKGLKRGAVS